MEEIKILLFTEDMIIYIEILQNPQTYNKPVQQGCMIQSQPKISCLLLKTRNEQSNEMKKQFI